MNNRNSNENTKSQGQSSTQPIQKPSIVIVNEGAVKGLGDKSIKK